MIMIIMLYVNDCILYKLNVILTYFRVSKHVFRVKIHTDKLVQFFRLFLQSHENALIFHLKSLKALPFFSIPYFR